MKKLKKLTLVEGTRFLSNPEMKHLQGGETFYYCHCLGNTGEGFEVSNCGECVSHCGAAGMQNCNIVRV